jgi:hypothetical protein
MNFELNLLWPRDKHMRTIVWSMTYTNGCLEHEVVIPKECGWDDGLLNVDDEQSLFFYDVCSLISYLV